MIPVLAANGTGGVEAGYVVYASIPMPVPIGSWCSVASKPIDFNASDETISRAVVAVVEILTKARTDALRLPETH